MTSVPQGMTRRGVLAAGGLAAAGAVGSWTLFPEESRGAATAAPDGHHGHHAAGRAAATSPPVQPFTTPMPVPPVLRPVAVTGTTDVYRLDLVPTTTEILPGVQTPVLTFGGHFVGPTIMAKTGRQVEIVYGNRLDRAANVHLHGGHVAADSDGHPMSLIAPGGAQRYTYPNGQQGATLWYHDHSHHTEAEHVYRGLHGFYLIRDEIELPLGLPTGPYDVPIMLRDALFDANGGLVFGTNPADRDTILANGKPQPYFRVARRKYRFRLLNSATERNFSLNLDGAQMVQIASDGGLLPAPAPRTEIPLSSGERVEVVVDFARHPIGSQLVLADGSRPVLRFDVVANARDTSRLPDELRPLPPLTRAAVVRDFVMSVDLSSGLPVGLMNGSTFDPARVDFRIKRGTTEIWNVRSVADEFGSRHNFHLHLEQFRVLDRNGLPPLPSDAGRKDTIFVPPGESSRIQATFTDFVGRYVLHCHFLEHSSIGLMAQFEVVP